MTTEHEQQATTGPEVGLSSREAANSSDLLYVLARNYEDARDYAYKQGHHYKRMVNVDRLEKLIGLRGIKLHVTANANYRANYEALMCEAKVRGLDIWRV